MAATRDARRDANWRDLGRRTLTSVILIPLVLLAVWLGDSWFQILVALLAVMMAHEWATIVHDRSSAQFLLHAAGGLSGALLAPDLSLVVAAIALTSIVSVALALRRETEINIWMIFGVAYVGLPAAAFIALRGEELSGMLIIMWLLIVVWAADILAYFAGRLIGGPKLAPRLSPNKTWSGLAGAITGAGAAGLAFGEATGLGGPLLVLGLGALLGLVEQLGDIFESALKRRYGIKDSGTLVPGHGGILDRVDGLVAAALVLATLVVAAPYLGAGNELFVR
jgi:phosphatidate cytidylyltransferase